MTNPQRVPAHAAPCPTLSRADYDAVIFDLDGVITRTARVHAHAWKATFDEFLRRRAEATGQRFVPFELPQDYTEYVDGKPRLDGVRDFLASRGIALPDGPPEEPDTVVGIGQRKNEQFLATLEKEGVEVFETSVRAVEALRELGFRTAIVSSSRNCGPVLEQAGLTHLFEARVDGVVSAEQHLTGKPAPDIFLQAAKELGVAPGRAVVVEDALSGVEAGCRGDFGLVIGVNRAQQAADLAARGADLVVDDLGELGWEDQEGRRRPPSALACFDRIRGQAEGRRLALLLDYDGTLTPIVERPEDAVLTDDARASVARVARRYPVAIVSGRDRADVQERVAIEKLAYAGSHGFDTVTPDGQEHVPAAAEDALPALDEAEAALADALADIDGSQLERKRFSLAIHYRRVAEERWRDVERAVDEAAQRCGLRRKEGKRVYELQPDLDWDKGAAVRWLLEALGLDGDDVLPIYIGDDLTDEDAFRALKDRGLGIVVLDLPRPTLADFSLDDPDEVRRFLDDLADAAETSA